MSALAFTVIMAIIQIYSPVFGICSGVFLWALLKEITKRKIGWIKELDFKVNFIIITLIDKVI